MTFRNVYWGKKVFVTGHTGFKGSWLTEWLLSLGAEVTGFSLPPATPALFTQLGLKNRIMHLEGDVRDLKSLTSAIEQAKPDFVFHLAAQPLVRLSYEQPVETYQTNVIGTVHVLEALRTLPQRCSAVFVTTDKCYENKEWAHSYREEDALGGHDPYSSSKAAAEIAISSFRRAYFSAANSLVRIASARAGNVIGGGDWAADRIVPDCIRALQEKKTISVRNKNATRPWQHVLEPLSGYLWLGACLLAPQFSANKKDVPPSLNFGPEVTSNKNVRQLVAEILKYWPGNWEDKTDVHAVHEATLLHLATDKAFHFLNWQPVWQFEETIKNTVIWYRQALAESSKISAITNSQISDYQQAAQKLGLAWSI